jgi:predicted RNA-binding protein associated with RNAse of E/G family
VVAQTAYPSKPVNYGGEEVLAAGYEAVWFLFKDEPFDVGRIYRPDGSWTGYYADVLEPVRWEGSAPETLEPIVDLFLDLWVAPDGGYAVLDEDELDAASAQGDVTEVQVRFARETLQRLISATREGRFPPPIVKDYPR